MKILLSLTILFTVPWAQAAINSSFEFREQVCEGGNQLQVEENVLRGKYQITGDKTQLMRTIGEKIETFNLGLMGKDTFMAAPTEIGTDPVVYFYVTVSEDGSMMEISVMDEGGALCGGGLVRTMYSAVAN